VFCFDFKGKLMKNQVINYELVCENIQQMQALGEKITVRNVLSRTGGTTGTVAKHLKQWQAENTEAKTANTDTIASEVIQAILLDKQSAISKAVESYKAQIISLESFLQEIGDKCNMQETQLAIKDSELKDLNEKFIAKLAILEVQLEISKAQVLELNQQLDSEKKKLELAVDAKYQAEKDAAILVEKHSAFQLQNSIKAKK
jgi:hypothetical protein